MKNKNILIVGTGAWGTALGCVLSDNHHLVKMYGTNSNQINDLKKGRNNTFFKNINLNFKPYEISNNLVDVIKNVEYLVLAIPTYAYQTFIKQYQKYIDKKITIVITSKGVEPNTKMNLYNYLSMFFKDNKICYLLGPSFAKEVINRKKTYVNAIANNIKVAKDVKNLFYNKNFLVDAIIDIDGASILSSFKNALAILFGLLNYLKVSINTKSAILTLAIKEIKHYMYKYGADVNTINEFCGIGDIYLTCSDNLSRNFQFGYEMGEIGIKKLIKKLDITVEGYKFINTFFNDKKNNKHDYIVFHTVYLLVNNKITNNKVVDHIWESYYEKK